MEEGGLSPERRRYLREKYGLGAQELDMLVEDLWAFTDETPEDFVRRRHSQLHKQGFRNEEIYKMIAEELGRGRFRTAIPSLRQVRRIIYG